MATAMAMEWRILMVDAATAILWLVCGWMARSFYQDYLNAKSESLKVWRPSNRRQ